MRAWQGGGANFGPVPNFELKNNKDQNASQTR